MTACRVCAAEFSKEKMGQIVCGPKCASRLPTVNRRAEREAKRDRKRKLDALQPRGYWLKTAQAAFNGWIRARDEFRGCISCATNHGKMNGGHYRSVGSCPELRFDEDNVHKQCERCNTFLHGNLLGYRAGLIGRIGLERVEWLEGPHEAKKYTVDDLKAIGVQYRARTREIFA